jgi:hypothetical protein
MDRPPCVLREYSPSRRGAQRPQKASMFFFEKKNQKTFPTWHTRQRGKRGKSFCFFFFRKRRILAY